jgi:hypothetical protein
MKLENASNKNDKNTNLQWALHTTLGSYKFG